MMHLGSLTSLCSSLVLLILFVLRELNDFLALNLIAAPGKSKVKDSLAWVCCYAEQTGAPVGKCPRCLHGKLRPNIKVEQFGRPIDMKKDKWRCVDFDEETVRGH